MTPVVPAADRGDLDRVSGTSSFLLKRTLASTLFGRVAPIEQVDEGLVAEWVTGTRTALGSSHEHCGIRLGASRLRNTRGWLPKSDAAPYSGRDRSVVFFDGSTSPVGNSVTFEDGSAQEPSAAEPTATMETPHRRTATD